MTVLALLIAKPAIGIVLAAALACLVPDTRPIAAHDGIGVLVPGGAGGITIGPVFLIAYDIDYSNHKTRTKTLAYRNMLIEHEQVHVMNGFADPRRQLVCDVLSLGWALAARLLPAVRACYDNAPWERRF
uniref:Uncharacterized protein n=1 Tax=viral metagenome TaxID=1070528 RepID=A0A6M3LBL8_9ZZZZ